MSYYRFITGIYKSYWPELNRTLRSSSSPRHVPQQVPSKHSNWLDSLILILMRSRWAGALPAPGPRLLQQLLLLWPSHGAALQWEGAVHAAPAELQLRHPDHPQPRPGDTEQPGHRGPLHRLRLQGDQLHGPAGQGGHRQVLGDKVTLREVFICCSYLSLPRCILEFKHARKARCFVFVNKHLFCHHLSWMVTVTIFTECSLICARCEIDKSERLSTLSPVCWCLRWKQVSPVLAPVRNNTANICEFYVNTDLTSDLFNEIKTWVNCNKNTLICSRYRSLREVSYPGESFSSKYNYYDGSKHLNDYLYESTRDVLGNFKHYNISEKTLNIRNMRSKSPLVTRELDRYS